MGARTLAGRAARLVAGLGLLSLAPGAGPVGAAERSVRIDHAGRDRVGFVHVPDGEAPAAGWPVVVAYHGGGGRAASFREYAGLDRAAGGAGFVVVYPDGIPAGRWLARRFHTWNAGGCCGKARAEAVDDVGFTWALLSALAAELPLDAARVCATGHSNGAMMAYRLAAESAARVAAIVPVGGAMQLAEFAPAAPVPVLHLHSADDPRALYGGGEGPPFPFTRTTVVHTAVEAGLARWARRAGCKGPGPPVPVRAAGDQRAERVTWRGCPAEAPVELLRLHGAGHGWPGPEGAERQARLARWLGPPSTVVDAAAEVAAFCARHRRPGAPPLAPAARDGRARSR